MAEIALAGFVDVLNEFGAYPTSDWRGDGGKLHTVPLYSDTIVYKVT